MPDPFDTIRARFIERADAMIARDVARLQRAGDLRLDDAGLRIAPEDFAAEASAFMPVEERAIDYAGFDAWLAANPYASRFPAYAGTYPDPALMELKAFEHWLSLQETEGAPGGAWLDVGCATSPFAALVEADHPDLARPCYRVDLPLVEYGVKPGVHGHAIGASASAIPLPDGSVARIYSHNAIEHFEGDAYEGLFHEAARLLVPGGALFVCPLFVARESFASVALTGIYRRLSFPRIRPGLRILHDEAMGQPYVLHVSASDLRRRIVGLVRDRLDLRLIRYLNAEERNYGVALAIKGVRKGPA